MKECLRCGGSAYRDFAYGCDHQFWDDVIPEPAVFLSDAPDAPAWWAEEFGVPCARGWGDNGGGVACRGEQMHVAWASLPDGKYYVTYHPTREGARQLWREQYAVGLMVDSLFRKLTGWAKEGAELKRRRALAAQAVWVRVAEEMDRECSPLGIASDRNLFSGLAESFVPGTVGVDGPDGVGVGMVHQVEVRGGAKGAELWALVDGVSREANVFAVIDLDPPRLRSVEAADGWVPPNETAPARAIGGWIHANGKAVRKPQARAFDLRKLDVYVGGGNDQIPSFQQYASDEEVAEIESALARGVRMGSFSYPVREAAEEFTRKPYAVWRAEQGLDVVHDHAMSGTPKVPAGWPDNRTPEEKAAPRWHRARAAALVGRTWMSRGVSWHVTATDADGSMVEVCRCEGGRVWREWHSPMRLTSLFEAVRATEVTSE